ncbi:MAG TPA: tetratricopeptide repeat protein [Candidatus Binatia bacterium]|jgi:Flp pilus assembly protein TadD
MVVALALAAVVVAAYAPALRGQFLEWDDNIYVLRNPYVRGLSWANVRWAFTTFHTGNWIPLTWLSHALDGTLWGLNPVGHHATALLLHVANTVLVFVVWRALTGALWRSAAVAALFGLHPLHVESVAWIAERKDLLSALCWLGALGAYVAYARRPSASRYAVVMLAFAAGLLAKPMGVTLPLVLLLLDWWPLGRWSRGAIVEKAPFAALAAVAATVAVAAQRAEGGIRDRSLVPIGARLANAVVSYVRYLELAVWPARLSPWYSHPALEGEPLSPGVVVASAAFVVGVTVYAIAGARRRPHIAVGWAWYVVTLLPVIGIVQVGGQAMADRYTYLPLLGIFTAVVWEIGAFSWWQSTSARRAGAVGFSAVLALLAVLTWRQTQVWHDSTTLWTTTLVRNPRAAIAYYALAGIDAREGRVDRAITRYRRALKLRPDYVSARRELARLLVGRGQYAAAAAQYRKALATHESAMDHNDLANVLLSQERTEAARRHLERARVLDPDLVEARNNLGIVLANEGRLAEAEAEFRAALRARPDFAPARANLAAVLAERTHTGAESP